MKTKTKSKKKTVKRTKRSAYQCKPMRKARITVARVLKLLKVPEGFTIEILAGNRYSEYDLNPSKSVTEKDAKRKAICLRNEKENIILVINLREGMERIDQGFSGHTFFKEENGWRSFDRLGVEDSFYLWLPEYLENEGSFMSRGKDFDVLADQVKRIRDRRQQVIDGGGWVTVPEIGYRILAGNLEERKKEFQENKTLRFMPSGFGTGFLLSIRPYRGAERSEVLAKFFNVPDCWVTKLDCD